MNQEIKQNNQISENPRKVAKRIQENKKDFLETFRECAGIITIACQKKGISRATFYNWLSGDKEFKKEVEEIKKEQI